MLSVLREFNLTLNYRSPEEGPLFGPYSGEVLPVTQTFNDMMHGAFPRNTATNCVASFRATVIMLAL